jgi:hypothetical protein
MRAAPLALRVRQHDVTVRRARVGGGARVVIGGIRELPELQRAPEAARRQLRLDVVQV